MPVGRQLREACAGPLLDWFARQRRDLPWRRRRTPYRVWVSELMLQQTRVDTVIPYFQRWMKRFPSLRALARAERDEVLLLWQGLGYYARARRLHQTARWLVAERGGRFPRDVEGLLALPGVGPYTAAAIGSLALGLDAAVLDGNVIRVLTRLLAYGEDASRPVARRHLLATAQTLLPPGRAGEFNEAMMELGALLCRSTQAHCRICPLAPVCRAHALERETDFPVRPKRKAIPHKVVGAGVILDRQGRCLLAQRHDHAMLGGLWEFPGGKQEDGESLPECVARELKEELGVEVVVGEHLVTVHHAYSHFTIELHAHMGRVIRGRPRPLDCADCRWVHPDDFDSLAFSKADLAIIEALRGR